MGGRYCVWLGVSTILLLVQAACAAPPHSADELLRRAAVASEEGSNKLELLEPAALESSNGKSTRTAGVLHLRLGNGLTKDFRDSPICLAGDENPDCSKNVLVAYDARSDVFVVANLRYEGSSYGIIDGSEGNETWLKSFPYLSPSRQVILQMIENDEELGWQVQLFERKGRIFGLTWADPLGAGGIYTDYTLMSWSNDDEPTIGVLTDGGRGKIWQAAFKLTRSELSWRALPLSYSAPTGDVH